MAHSLIVTSELLLLLFEGAEKAAYFTAERIRKRRRPAPRRGVGRTLRPGAQTPLWNILVNAALPYLGKYGTKARVARYLGLPRQRMQDCLKSRQASLDAERTLRLLCWVAARQKGWDPSI
jgi:hypothetical protein